MLEEDDLSRYRRFTKSQASMKLFVDEEILVSLLDEYKLAMKFKPVLRDDLIPQLDDSASGVSNNDVDVGAFSGTEYQNVDVSGDEAERDDDGSEVEENTMSKKSSRIRARLSTSRPKASHSNLKERRNSRRNSSTADLESTSHATPIYTPYTLEIKVAKKGCEPYYIAWSHLNIMEKLLVFKTALETRDQVLERKRPWIAKFLSMENVEDLEFYSKKYCIDFKREIHRILEMSALPSDEELAAFNVLSMNADANRLLPMDGDAMVNENKRMQSSPSALENIQRNKRPRLDNGNGKSSTVNSFDDNGSQYTNDYVRDLENRFNLLSKAHHQLVNSVGMFYYQVENQMEGMKKRLEGFEEVKKWVSDIQKQLGITLPDTMKMEEDASDSLNNNASDELDPSTATADAISSAVPVVASMEVVPPSTSNLTTRSPSTNSNQPSSDPVGKQSAEAEDLFRNLNMAHLPNLNLLNPNMNFQTSMSMPVSIPVHMNMGMGLPSLLNNMEMANTEAINTMRSMKSIGEGATLNPYMADSNVNSSVATSNSNSLANSMMNLNSGFPHASAKDTGVVPSASTNVAATELTN